MISNRGALGERWRIGKIASMRSSCQNWGHVVLLGLVICVLSGCQLNPYIRHVHEDEHLVVRLEDHTGGPFPENPMPFDHPVALPEEQWERVLRAIQIHQERGGNPAFRKDSGRSEKEQVPLFTDEDISFLTPVVAQAFGQARSTEWVTFVMWHHLGSYEWLNRAITAQSMTSGGFYVANHRLHLYLINIRSPITSTAIKEQIWENPFYATDATNYQIESNATQTVTKHPQQGLRGKINPLINEVTLEMGRIFDVQEGWRQRQSLEGKSLATPARDEPEVTKKFRELLILQQQGLITQEDYDEMKKTLLEEFVDKPHGGK